MATNTRAQEAQQASNAYHLALAYLGYSVMEDAWQEWQRVDLARPRATSAAWADAVLALVQAAREQARLLARLFYRLNRALMTGTTVSAPAGTDVRERETLGDLRRDFRLAVEDIVPPQRKKPTTPHTRRMWKRAGLSEPLPKLPQGGFEEDVEVEDFDWPEDDDKRIEGVLDAHFDNLVIDLEKRRQERLSKKADMDSFVEDRRDKVGTMQSAAAQLSTLNAGRRELFLAGGKDAKVLGYVRVSKTGDPCHFCAMLISRGMVLYSSRKAAGDKDYGGAEYHPGCWCYSEPIFSKTQYESDERFDLNRELKALWDSHIRKRYSGSEALNEWRKLIRRRRAEARDQEDTADARAA